MRWKLGTAFILMIAVGAAMRAADEPSAEQAAPAAGAPSADAPAAAEASTEGTTADPAAAEAAAAEFAKLNASFVDIRDQLNKLADQYKAAKKDEKPAIVEQYNKLLEEGEALRPQLQTAAEAAFTADPAHSDDARSFLAGAAVAEFRNDNFEEADRLLSLLIANDFPDKGIYDLAGITAFELTDLDKAEALLNTAKQEKVLGRQGSSYLASIPQSRENWAREQAIREAEAKADDLPRVLLKTSKGDITIELFENQAPNTVANFISLVEKGFYNGLTFHRVLPGFMAQGGCPDGTGGGGPGYNIPCECDREDHRLHFRGTLSMAHAGKDTGGSQFFLTFRPTDHLDGKHTAFGRVIDGMEVLSKLQRRDPDDPNRPEPDTIIEATVIRKRDHEYTPMKTPE
jgi:cyclophilin family peptidyl-prolyl cis-trans isomerase